MPPRGMSNILFNNVRGESEIDPTLISVAQCKLSRRQFTSFTVFVQTMDLFKYSAFGFMYVRFYRIGPVKVC